MWHFGRPVTGNGSLLKLVNVVATVPVELTNINLHIEPCHLGKIVVTKMSLYKGRIPTQEVVISFVKNSKTERKRTLSSFIDKTTSNFFSFGFTQNLHSAKLLKNSIL